MCICMAESGASSVLSQGVDPQSTFYVLNPHNNLSSTEERQPNWDILRGFVKEKISFVLTLLTKVHIVKAMVFPIVMYGCES